VRVVYVAKHGCGDNDDEGAIAHALRELGHDAVLVDERTTMSRAAVPAGDLLLFHKWARVDLLRRLAVPRVFWYFDLVESSDPALMQRSRARTSWMQQVLPCCTTAFCTDGDWAAKAGLYHLMQGADERYAGFGTPSGVHVPLLFTGTKHHGRAREAHIAQLKALYGAKLLCIGDTSPRLHGRALADAFASCDIAVAPDSPCSDRYWSNRVYLTLSLGGFLLHPRCAMLAEHYVEREELVMYRDRLHLVACIEFYLQHPALRANIARRGYERTIREHLYRHRVAELLKAAQESM
jgi:hypothetical protein